MFEEIISNIENELQKYFSSIKANYLEILFNYIYLITKDFLISENIIKSPDSKQQYYWFYNRYFLYPESASNENIFFAISYNERCINNAEQLKKIVPQIFSSKGHFGKNAKLLFKDLLDFNTDKYFEELNIHMQRNKIPEEEVRYLILSIQRTITNLQNLAQLTNLSNNIGNSIIQLFEFEIDNFINARKSPTRGMEPSSPFAFIKGTITTICFLSLIGETFYSRLIMKEKEHYKHLKEDVPEHHWDGNKRDLLLYTGSFFGVIWGLGCKPLLPQII